jgi:hypothetical protein
MLYRREGYSAREKNETWKMKYERWEMKNEGGRDRLGLATEAPNYYSSGSLSPRAPPGPSYLFKHWLHALVRGYRELSTGELVI